MAEEAVDEEIRDFYAGHAEATTDQIDRIEGLFDAVDADPDRREHPEFESLLDHREELLADTTNVRLEGVLNAETGRAIERVEITTLETLLTLADRLGLESEATEDLRATEREAENGLDSLREISLA